jgi:hypothetical protein
MAMGRANPIISGSSMAVLLGFLSVLGAFVVPELTFGDRALLFIFGVIVFVLGLIASSG